VSRETRAFMTTTSICVVITTTQKLMNGDVCVDVDNVEMQIQAPGYEPDTQSSHGWLRQYVADRCNEVLTARTSVAAERAAKPAIATKAQWFAHVADMKGLGIDVSTTYFDTPEEMQAYVATLKEVAE